MPSVKTNLKSSIGAQIKQLRASAGLTQMELAIKMGVSPVNVSLWENGRNLPDSRYLEVICDVFGVELVFNVKKAE
jgi:transcriptional regulator with XRE-family HTH domain